MSEPKIRFTELNASLPSSVPFVGPETLERHRGTEFSARLGANESAFGMSPSALTAIADTAKRASWYGDPENHALRQSLATLHGVAPEEIMIGAGIDGILGNIVRMMIEPGVSVTTSAGAYPTFNYHVKGFGGTLHTVPYKDDQEDPYAILQKAKDTNSALVYFANPDNPIGSWHPAHTVKELINNIPEGAVLVLDEAYIEFAPKGTAPPLDPSNPRVMRMRTFSKAHGMAGLRIGYTIAHKDLITGLNKVRNHFEVSRIAQAAALASLQDEDYLASVIARVDAGRAQIAEIARNLDLKPLPSATNFVTIDMGKDGDHARAVLKALDEKGIFIRMPGIPPLDRCIRVTVGTEEENTLFGQKLAEVLSA